MINENTPAEQVWPHLQKGHVKNAFNRGFKSFYKGWLDNPYKVGTDQYKEWERGFTAAYFKQKARYS